jgi:hypothetical protein
MCSDLPRFGARRSTLALGLILAAGAAQAQTPPAWVDPPAKVAPGTPAPKAEPQPQSQPQAQQPPARESTRPASETAAGTGRNAKPDRETAQPAGNAASPAPAFAETERDGAAMGGPSRRAERPRLRRRSARRLSDTPAADTLTVAPRIPSGAREAAADPRFADWAGQAQGLAEDYLASFSGSNGAMVSGASRFYGERLRFHGRMTTFAALLAEKRRFAQRWPERRYEPHDTRTACNAALQSCVVRTLVDFRAGNPARGARSQGVAELVLEVSFAGGRPVIVSESSRVLRRGATVGALPGAGANG